MIIEESCKMIDICVKQCLIKLRSKTAQSRKKMDCIIVGKNKDFFGAIMYKKIKRKMFLNFFGIAYANHLWHCDEDLSWTFMFNYIWWTFEMFQRQRNVWKFIIITAQDTNQSILPTDQGFLWKFFETSDIKKIKESQKFIDKF